MDDSTQRKRYFHGHLSAPEKGRLSQTIGIDMAKEQGKKEIEV